MSELNICRVRDAAGALVIDASADGFRTVSLSDEQETWDVKELTSWCVDGSEEGSSRAESFTMTWVVRIEGTSWAAVETARLALKAATRVRVWLLEVETDGVITVWRAGRASSRSVAAPEDVANRQRTVTMTFTVQPTPTVTGV